MPWTKELKKGDRGCGKNPRKRREQGDKKHRAKRGATKKGELTLKNKNKSKKEEDRVERKAKTRKKTRRDLYFNHIWLST